MFSKPSNLDLESERKENIDDQMKEKLNTIQTGKAYLEKKIQEYESRLN